MCVITHRFEVFMNQKKMVSKVRIQPRVDETVVRLAKAKCVTEGITLEGVVERLLRRWTSGNIDIFISDENKTR
jgi:hypothetical protein